MISKWSVPASLFLLLSSDKLLENFKIITGCCQVVLTTCWYHFYSCASVKKVVYNIKTQQEVPFVFLKQESSALMIRPLKQSQTLTKQYYRTLSFPHVTCDFISASCFVKMSHCFLYSTTCLFNWITTKKKKTRRKKECNVRQREHKKQNITKKEMYKGEEISFTISHNFY